MKEEAGRAFLLSDLIARVQLKNRDLPPRLVDRAVRRIFETMVDTLAEGGRVELRNFGVLELRERDGGIGRNPRTNARIEIEPHRAVHWRTSKALNTALNEPTDQ